MFRFLALVLVVALASRANAADTLDLNGRWSIEEASGGASAEIAAGLKGQELIVANEWMALPMGGGRVLAVNLQVDAKASPIRIDLTPLKKRSGSRNERKEREPVDPSNAKVLGIVKGEGDSLEIRLGKPDGERPTEFTDDAESGFVSFKLKRTEKLPTVEKETKLVGEWKADHFEGGGSETLEPEKKESAKIVIGERIAVMHERFGEMPVLITVDAKASPKTVDLEPLAKSGFRGNTKILAIYEVDGDTLRLCFQKNSAERPTKFEADDKTTVATFKRSAKK
jgi:uncharacterized protein (TIGR03067 family)